MPRPIDHEERRREIISIARRLIAEEGAAAAGIRSIAGRMGGSTSLVTHYFPTQGELLKAIAREFVEGWRADLRGIEERHPDPLERLKVILLDWMVPLEGEDLLNEQVRINLVASELQGSPDAREVIDILEMGVKEELRRALRELVPYDAVEHYVDVICVAYNGVALSTVEQADLWTADRQRSVLRTVFDLLPLDRSGCGPSADDGQP